MKKLCALGVSVVSGVAASAAEPDAKTIEAAIGKSLALLEKSAAQYSEQRSCFSCHHQALPAVTLSLARERGFAVNAKAMAEQAEFTQEFFANRKEAMPKGKGVPGGSYTTGYALLALSAANWKADDIAALMVQHLLQRQEASGRWSMGTRRPPLEYSHFTSTALSLRGLQLFAEKENSKEISGRVARARQWLLAAKPKETEDRIWHLLGLKWSGVDRAAISKAAKALLGEQRPDGGWAQTAQMKSDPYATGQVLTALQLAGGAPVKDIRWQKGIAWLLRAQKADGSWHVKSRSKPFQKYLETGYPHGKDQFISIGAGSWATMALLLTRPPVTGKSPMPLENSYATGKAK
ncbi:MAG: terpene cyclase/mutase family protein [Verrucomicrobia subdivision 3 bacterium]|nr:terpene cyclase/mutase family protein [Limisphaerales bacterium]